MDYNYPESAEKFRLEIRSWLEKNFSKDFQDLDNRGDINAADLPKLKAWNKIHSHVQGQF